MAPRGRAHVVRAALAGVIALAQLGCGDDRSMELPPGFAGTRALSGTLSGSFEARAWAPDCAGFVPTEPNYEVLNEAMLPYVRVVVNGGDVDTTLALQLPDGTYRCNDDTEGHHPQVETRLPAGLTRIWVGRFVRTATGPYTLALSTDRSVTAASLVVNEAR